MRNFLFIFMIITGVQASEKCDIVKSDSVNEMKCEELIAIKQNSSVPQKLISKQNLNLFSCLKNISPHSYGKNLIHNDRVFSFFGMKDGVQGAYFIIDNSTYFLDTSKFVCLENQKKYIEFTITHSDGKPYQFHLFIDHAFEQIVDDKKMKESEFQKLKVEYTKKSISQKVNSLIGINFESDLKEKTSTPVDVTADPSFQNSLRDIIETRIATMGDFYNDQNNKLSAQGLEKKEGFVSVKSLIQCKSALLTGADDKITLQIDKELKKFSGFVKPLAPIKSINSNTNSDNQNTTNN